MSLLQLVFIVFTSQTHLILLRYRQTRVRIVGWSYCLFFTTLHSIINFVAPSNISTTPKCIKILDKKRNSNGKTALLGEYSRLTKQTLGNENLEKIAGATITFNVSALVNKS